MTRPHSSAPAVPAGLTPGAAQAPRPAPANTMLGIGLMILSMWVLPCLDASGKWVMTAGVPLLVLCWVRYTVHLAVVLAVVLPTRGTAILRSRRPSAQVLRGGCMLLATASFFTTLRYLPQAEATAINFLAPLILLSLAPWVLNEPPRTSRWVAAAVGLVGVLIIIRPGGGLHPVGVLSGLVTACCFAAQYIATRRVAVDNPLTSLVWSGAVGSACLSLAMPLALPAALPVLAQLEPVHWLVMLSTGVSGSVGHLLQIAAYRNAPASLLAPFIYFQIVSATATGWLIWGDFPDALTWVGIGIICGSGIAIGIVEWRRSRMEPA